MTDDSLGMSRPITRRDFLNGMAVSAAALALGGCNNEFAPEKAPGYYPPGLTGIRGNHDGTYTYAHKLRDGVAWDAGGAPRPTGESYDLVVVGAGISGLSAAYFFRQQNPQARILLLDNHDDFGGHAKRNEFEAGGRRLISYGGTQSIESPSDYSDVGKKLLKDLGIEVKRFYQDFDRKLYESMHLGTGVFFDRETFGKDALVVGVGTVPWPQFLAQAPLSEVARRDIARLYTSAVDYLPQLSANEKRKRLAKISYADYLIQVCHASKEVLPFFQTLSHDLFCVGIEAVSALECYEAGNDYGLQYAGFDGLKLGHGNEGADPYIFHFPDGNASIARMLVRSMVPGSISGHDMDDIVTATADYGRLDDASQPVRIRLNSTVMRVQHAAGQKEVEVAYMRGERLHSVRAAYCVMACYNAMIPYICPELPQKQRDALATLIKAPLVYTHVAVRNWTSFHNLKVKEIEAPGSYHSYTALDDPVSIGQYKFPSHPEEAAVIFMLRTPCAPGKPMRQQNMYGRAELYKTKFETFERNIREQLGRMLGAGGFDPARDIQGITVNRWAHGYSFAYSSMWDPDWKPGEQPWVIGRKPLGRIAIANCDSGGDASTDEAIVQAWRALLDLKEGRPHDTPERKRKSMPHA